jgi:hypothetical protein
MAAAEARAADAERRSRTAQAQVDTVSQELGELRGLLDYMTNPDLDRDVEQRGAPAGPRPAPSPQRGAPWGHGRPG